MNIEMGSTAIEVNTEVVPAEEQEKKWNYVRNIWLMRIP